MLSKRKVLQSVVAMLAATAPLLLSTKLAVAQNAPKFTSAGVVNGASLTPGIAPGSFISIFGEDLAPVTGSWEGAIQGTALPTQLEGVSVLVGGKPAYLSFISPNQLNALLATDDIAGSMEINVMTPFGRAVANAEIQPYAPRFFSLNRTHIVATHGDNVLVGEVGQIPGLLTRPAQRAR